MRKFFLPFVLALLLPFACANRAGAEPNYVKQAALIESVNMYRDPEDPSSVLGSLDVGAEVTVLELSGGWAEIEYMLRIGYINRSALAVEAEQADASFGITMLGRSLYVCEDAQAGARGDIPLAAGEAVTLLGTGVGGAKVLAGGRICDVPLNLLAPDAECCYPFGAVGDSIAPMQSRLEELGFYDGANTGVFDMETAMALIRFRAQIGFEHIFLMDEYTYECLYADDAPESMIRIAHIRLGDTGNAVSRLQTRLIAKGYLETDVLGYFDGLTLRAVWLFQERANLPATGEADPATLSALFASGAPALPEGASPAAAATGEAFDGAVVLDDWFTSDIQEIFAVDSVARFVDLQTGIAWYEMRRGGYNHADTQPLTAKDTALFKMALGGEWSWERRPIWVVIGGVRYAASMNGMPHGQGSIEGNNFDGHHCVHFLNSRTHGTNSRDERHQACVQTAARTAVVTLRDPVLSPAAQGEAEDTEDGAQP